ncbi:hypothetical protein PENTCL1PPCAC_5869, partial [Pristionchus entomophagus]
KCCVTETLVNKLTRAKIDKYYGSLLILYCGCCHQTHKCSHAINNCRVKNECGIAFHDIGCAARNRNDKDEIDHDSCSIQDAKEDEVDNVPITHGTITSSMNESVLRIMLSISKSLNRDKTDNTCELLGASIVSSGNRPSNSCRDGTSTI